MVAVGECGLDLSDGFPDISYQLPWFKQQLEMACALQKPLFLHERAAHELFISEIQKHDNLPPAVVHCFTGTSDELDTYLKMGFYIGVTGYICKQKHGQHLRSILPRIPLDRLLIETDAPYMGFPKCRKGHSNPKKQYPNVPTSLAMVVETIAKCLQLPMAQVANKTTLNARRFLRL